PVAGQSTFAVHISLTVSPKSVHLDLAERLLNDEDDVEDERLDVEAMDAAMSETIARYDLSDPDQRAYLRQTFEQTKTHAEAKIADHTAMLTLSEKYLEIVTKAGKKPQRRHLREVN